MCECKCTCKCEPKPGEIRKCPLIEPPHYAICDTKGGWLLVGISQKDIWSSYGPDLSVDNWEVIYRP
jgi:hypothetical protein